MRYFNWKLAIVLLLGFGIIAGTVAGLHYFQESGRYGEYRDLGLASFDEGQWQEAATLLGKYIPFIENDPNKIDILHKYAEAQLKIRPSKRGNTEQAIGSFHRILRIDSGDRKAARQLAKMYLRNRRTLGEARQVAEDFLKGGRRDAVVECILADALFNQRQFDEAYTTLESVIENEPNQIMAYQRLADITRERSDDYDENAAHWLDKAVETNRESPSAYLARARFHLFDQEKTLAVRKAMAQGDLEMALTKTLTEAEEHMETAWLCRILKQEDRVREQLDAIQEREPDHLGMWVFRAGMALASRDKEHMRQVADESQAALKDNKWDFLGIAAELYVRAGDYDQARACLKGLINENDRPAEVAFLEGLIAYQQDRTQEAVQRWQRALSLGYSGPSSGTQYYLGFKPLSLKFLLASAQAQLGDPMSSRQLLSSLASDNRNDAQVQVLLARHMAGIGDWMQAKMYAQQSLIADPNNSDAEQLNLEADVMLLVDEGEAVSENKWQEVEQRVQRLEGTDEDPMFSALLTFHIALARKDYSLATALLDQLAPTDPVGQQKAVVARVSLLSAQEKTDEILDHLKDAIKTHGQSVYLVRLLALSLLETGDKEAVEQVLVDGMSTVESPQGRLKLGLTLSDLLDQWALKQKDEALLEKLNQEYPDSILVQRQRLQHKKVTDPQAVINRIKALEGEEGWQWRYEQARLWSVKNDQSKYSEGVSLLEQNLRRNSNNQQSRTLLATIYGQAGESSRALATYRDAMDREPDNLSIIIPAVKALLAARELDEADAILQRVTDKEFKNSNPDQFRVFSYLDQLQVSSYLQRGRINDAADLMEACLDNDPNNLDNAIALAEIRLERDEYDGAKAIIDNIRESAHDKSTTFKIVQLEVRMLMGQRLSAEPLEQQRLSTEALERCDHLVETFKDPNSLMLRFGVRVALNQIDEAKDDMEKAISIAPDDVDLLLRKSKLYWSLGQVEEALQAMDDAYSRAPKNPDVLVQAISLFSKTGSPERVRTAKALLEQASTLHPEDHRLKIQTVEYLLQDGDAVSEIEAEALLELLTIDHPKKVQAWLMLGELFLKRESWVKAQNVAIRGLTELNDNLDLLSLKARAEIEISPSFAVQTLEAMLEHQPALGIAINLANAYVRAKKPEKAIEVLSEYEALCTEAATEVFQLTRYSALLESGQDDKATALLDQLKKQYPANTIRFQTKNWINEGDLEAVERELMAWLKNRPEDTTPLEFAVTRLHGVGHAKALDVASRLLIAAVDEQPESEPLLMRLALTWQLQGLLEQAAQRYERVLEVHGRNVVAMNNVAWIYGHDLTQQKGITPAEKAQFLEKGLEWARKGLTLAPQYTDLLDTYGTLCYGHGNYDEAIKSLKECLERPSYQRQPSTAATMYHLAKSYQAIGEKSNAQLMFRQCLDRSRQLEHRGVSALNMPQTQDIEAQVRILQGN